MLCPVSFEIPVDLYPFEHRFIDLPGGARVHYVDEGKGETILFLHGNPTWSFLYRNIVRELRGSFRCIALDYPGFGMSQAPPGYGFTPREHSRVVESFVDALGLADLTVMVQDWGGPIGLGLAGRRPDRIARLVLGNTWAWPPGSSLRWGIFSWMFGGPVGLAISWSFNGVVRMFLAQGAASALPARVVAAYLAPFKDRAARRPVTLFPWLITRSNDYLAEVERGLPALSDKPVLIVWGQKDFAFDETVLRRLQRLFPRNRTHLLRNAGHFIQEDAPAEISGAILDWMRADG